MLTRQYIDEHQLIERYLSDQLSDTEREQFESYYVEHPELLDDMQVAASIKLGTGLLRKSGELQQLTTAGTRGRWSLPLALAASLLVAVLGVWLLRTGTDEPIILSRSLNDFVTPLSEGGTYQLQRTRSDVDAIVTLPSTAQAIKLRVRPVMSPRPQALRVELASLAADESLTPLAKLEQLHLDADGLLTVYVNSAGLRPGEYQLSVMATPGDAGAKNEFVVRVEAAAELQ